MVQLTTKDISSGNGHSVIGKPTVFPEVNNSTCCNIHSLKNCCIILYEMQQALLQKNYCQVTI